MAFTIQRNRMAAPGPDEPVEPHMEPTYFDPDDPRHPDNVDVPEEAPKPPDANQ